MSTPDGLDDALFVETSIAGIQTVAAGTAGPLARPFPKTGVAGDDELPESFFDETD